MYAIGRCEKSSYQSIQTKSHKIGHASSVEHYGVMNDRPNTPVPKQENDENDSKRKRLHQLALRQKVINIASDHYGIMNNRPIIPVPNQENDEVEDIIDLYDY
ncbi:2349_t:CDS:2 [Entrophospora sp. SA101]|nr:2349_t:CDS:2 [Entrophospora sp. SA101]